MNLNGKQVNRSNFNSIGILGLCSALIIACGWYVVSNVTINSDMQQFLPENSGSDTDVHSLKVLKAINQSGNGLFMLAIKGGSAKERANASIRLQKKLSKIKDFILVSNGKNALTGKDRKILFKYRYLLTTSNDDGKYFNKENISSAISERYKELTSPLSGIIKINIRNDPTAEVRAILSKMRAGKEPAKRHSVWFSHDDTLALLLARVNINGADINQQQRVLDSVKKVFNEINDNNLELILSGAGTFAVSARSKIKAESQNISIIASIGVMIFIYFAFRSFWFVLLAGLPLFVAILSGVTITHLIYGDLQGITLAFGLVLIGVALDYPVHVFSHLVASEGVKQSVKNIWPTLRLGVVTTGMGFFALTQTSFNGIAQLGVFAISGLLAAAWFTRFILPLFIKMWSLPEVRKMPDWLMLASNLRTSFSLYSVVFSIALVSVLFIFFPVSWENDMAKLSPVPKQALQIERQLRKQLNAEDFSNVAVVVGETSDEVLSESESLTVFLNSLINENIISAYRAPFQILPSIEKQQIRQNLLPAKTSLEKIVGHATLNSAFKQDSFMPFIEDVTNSRSLTPLNINELNGTALGERLSSMLISDNKSWYAIIRFIDVADRITLEKRINDLGQPEVLFLNTKQISQIMIDNFRNEAIKLFYIGLMIIFAILALSLKNIYRLMQVSFIVSMAIVCTLLLLNITGVALSIFHLVSLLLVLGLGLDYSLFFTRAASDLAERRRTFISIAVCFGSTALVFGMLASSSIPVLHAIGMTVLIGVIFSFIFASLFSYKAQYS